MKSKNLHVGRSASKGSKEGGGGRWRLPAALALAWAAMIFVASALPGSTYPQVGFRAADKLVHLAIYAVLGALCAAALAGRRVLPPSGRRGWVTVALGGALLAALYGVTDELHQLFVPGRSADPEDLLADVAGALLGAALAVALIAARARRGGGPP